MDNKILIQEEYRWDNEKEIISGLTRITQLHDGDNSELSPAFDFYIIALWVHIHTKTCCLNETENPGWYTDQY